MRAPNVHDHKKNKSRHHIIHLQTTVFLPLILKADEKDTSLYIDGAHVVHADMKEHDRVNSTMGACDVYASSTKSKINTVSSTETEVISVGEKLPKHLWFRNFVYQPLY